MSIKSKLYITGDTHGHLSIDKFTSKLWPEGKTLTKKDCVIIAGDFGLVFYPEGNKTEQYWLDWLEQRPWTTLFIDGNHENFPRLYSYPEEERFGGPVGVIRPSVLHLKKRGHVYDIDGNNIWCFGGAYSIDKAMRTAGVSWWPEEEPSREEMEYGLEQVEKYRGNFNFVVTHDCPSRVLYSYSELLIYSRPEDIVVGRTGQYLEQIADLVKTKEWFFGHYHTDITCECTGRRGLQKYRALYHDIVRIV